MDMSALPPTFNAEEGLAEECGASRDGEENRDSREMAIVQGTVCEYHVPVTSRKGFTLIEVLLVVAVIGILSGIAVPAYSAYMQKARASAAVLAIGVIQKAIEAYFVETGTYPSSLADVGMDTMRDPWGHPYQYLRIAGAGDTSSTNGQAAAGSGSASGGSSSGTSSSGNSSTNSGSSSSGAGNSSSGSGRGSSGGGSGGGSSNAGTGGQAAGTSGGNSSGSNASTASTTGGSSGNAGITGNARKDHFMVPINTDYDLYSMGPDGKSATPLTAEISQDDIIRASDGTFIGRACDF